jgi:hypothetical protein
MKNMHQKKKRSLAFEFLYEMGAIPTLLNMYRSRFSEHSVWF